MFEAATFILIFIFSYFGVEFFRRWSWRRELFDLPNERSSHTEPTPRGGGAIIAAVSLTVYAAYSVVVSGTLAWGYVLGAVLIAAISWLDDLYSVLFVWRLLVHALAALLVIFTLGYFGEIAVPLIGKYQFGIGGALITFLWIVWLTNAYNFMDGIDGIAGMQAVTAGIGWLLIGRLLDFNTAGFYGGVLAFSSLGFLLHNWQPAKIFMGDVGSAFLGYSFAVIPLLAKNETAIDNVYSPYLLFTAISIVWLFVFDTVLTFIKRLVKSEKFWNAHRSHIYQRLVLSGHSHQWVTSLYGLISILNVLAIVLWHTGAPDTNNFRLLPAVIGLSGAGLLIYQYCRQTKSV